MRSRVRRCCGLRRLEDFWRELKAEAELERSPECDGITKTTMRKVEALLRLGTTERVPRRGALDAALRRSTRVASDRRGIGKYTAWVAVPDLEGRRKERRTRGRREVAKGPGGPVSGRVVGGARGFGAVGRALLEAKETAISSQGGGGPSKI
ncbi:hypothetical protein B0H17DRAFT_1174428 [Mycena rosella]|uniref:Uncharacterized protein n=1 Tax=Mycena rosella TaxID=1033263 RepID=A0AAD7GYZ2_MYCRO|nr:hypothetical protein B0H17DRAFT_1174428 [Mycena rosella]